MDKINDINIIMIVNNIVNASDPWFCCIAEEQFIVYIYYNTIIFFNFFTPF